jgi:hypothetical protein
MPIGNEIKNNYNIYVLKQQEFFMSQLSLENRVVM